MPLLPNPIARKNASKIVFIPNGRKELRFNYSNNRDLEKNYEEINEHYINELTKTANPWISHAAAITSSAKGLFRLHELTFKSLLGYDDKSNLDLFLKILGLLSGKIRLAEAFSEQKIQQLASENRQFSRFYPLESKVDPFQPMVRTDSSALEQVLSLHGIDKKYPDFKYLAALSSKLNFEIMHVLRYLVVLISKDIMSKLTNESTKDSVRFLSLAEDVGVIREGLGGGYGNYDCLASDGNLEPIHGENKNLPYAGFLKQTEGAFLTPILGRVAVCYSRLENKEENDAIKTIMASSPNIVNVTTREYEDALDKLEEAHEKMEKISRPSDAQERRYQKFVEETSAAIETIENYCGIDNIKSLEQKKEYENIVDSRKFSLEKGTIKIPKSFNLNKFVITEKVQSTIDLAIKLKLIPEKFAQIITESDADEISYKKFLFAASERTLFILDRIKFSIKNRYRLASDKSSIEKDLECANELAEIICCSTRDGLKSSSGWLKVDYTGLRFCPGLMESENDSITEGVVVRQLFSTGSNNVQGYPELPVLCVVDPNIQYDNEALKKRVESYEGSLYLPADRRDPYKLKIPTYTQVKHLFKGLKYHEVPEPPNLTEEEEKILGRQSGDFLSQVRFSFMMMRNERIKEAYEKAPPSDFFNELEVKFESLKELSAEDRDKEMLAVIKERAPLIYLKRRTKYLRKFLEDLSTVKKKPLKFWQTDKKSKKTPLRSIRFYVDHYNRETAIDKVYWCIEDYSLEPILFVKTHSGEIMDYTNEIFKVYSPKQTEVIKELRTILGFYTNFALRSVEIDAKRFVTPENQYRVNEEISINYISSVLTHKYADEVFKAIASLKDAVKEDS